MIDVEEKINIINYIRLHAKMFKDGNWGEFWSSLDSFAHSEESSIWMDIMEIMPIVLDSLCFILYKEEKDLLDIISNEDGNSSMWILSTLNKKDVIIPAGVTGLDDFYFSGDSTIETLYIHSGVKCMSDQPFSGCKNLKEVIIDGDSIRSLDGDAFRNCPNLKTVKCINNKVKEYILNNAQNV